MLPPVQPLKLSDIFFFIHSSFSRDNMRQEELSKTVLQQNETLLDNNNELRKYDMLKVVHQVELRQHEKSVNCLHEAEGNIRRLDSQLQVSHGFEYRTNHNPDAILTCLDRVILTYLDQL